MFKSIAFDTNKITVTLADDTSVVYTTAPVVTDEKVTVTHSDGTTQEFDVAATA